MEIRNALQKIENYLTVVSNLNKTILSEGAMSREELLLMKKYLNSCIERIGDIERKLSINTEETVVTTGAALLTNTTEIVETAHKQEIVEVDENLNIDNVEAVLDNTQKEELELALDEIEKQVELQDAEIETPVATTLEHAETALHKTEETTEIPEVELNEIEKVNFANEQVEQKKNVVEEVQTTLETETKQEEQTFTVDHILNSVTETIDELENKAEEIKNSELVQKVETQLENFAAVTEQKIEHLTQNFKKEEEIENDKETLVSKLEEQKKSETSFFEKLESKFKEDKAKPLFHLFDDGKEDFHETMLNKNQDDKIDFKPEKNEIKNEEFNTVLVKDELIIETKAETLQTSTSLNDIFKTAATTTHVETIQQPKVRKTLQELIMLNDKFVFVRELFGNQFAEYDTAIKTLEAMQNLNEAENFCRNSLWNKFNWNEKVAYQMRFFDVLQKRFV